MRPNLYSLDVAVLIGGETESPLGSKTVATISTISTSCGLFDSVLPDLPDKRSMAAATVWMNKYVSLIYIREKIRVRSHLLTIK